MNLIDSIQNKDELINFRNHVQGVLKRRLGARIGKSFGQREFDELTAEVLGVANLNTALGILANREGAEPPLKADDRYCVSSELNGLCSVIAGLLAQDYVSEADLFDVLDDLVFEHVGTSKAVSDNINNQGYERQIMALKAQMALSCVYEPLSEAAGLKLSDLKKAVDLATRSRVREFDVTGLVGY